MTAAAGAAAVPGAQRLLAASDLDQTLVFSRRSAEVDVAGLVPVEEYDGRTISWVTPAAWELLGALVASGAFVPATTRTAEQYLRIRWPHRPPHLAVCANGGVILVDGAPDEAWTARVRARLAGCAPLERVHAEVARAVAAAHAAVPGSEGPAVRDVPGLFCYAVLRDGQRAALEGPLLGDLTVLLDGWGYAVSLQGRKLYAVPRPLTKSAAVAEVVRRGGFAGSVAAGDSLLDADLLAAARAAVRPGHGELFRSGWEHPRVRLLASSGAAAGEETARWLLAAVAPGSASGLVPAQKECSGPGKVPPRTSSA
ncbi:HAD family hydrolase [Kineococcus sp. SYSU DK005]|uniref:HAD family hydrolase n=1 Tax=Kineococcus sp. SYSU DK005 TaxID=3383126 RepID=UPI003D7C5372